MGTVEFGRAIIMFVIGAVIFSALNPVIYSLPEKRAYSKSVIRYVFIAILGGVLAAVDTHYFGYGFKALTYYAFFCVLLVVTFVDQDTMEIPPVLNVIILVLGVISIWSVGGLSIIDRIIGMFCISLPLFLIIQVVPDGFGGGDIKLMFAAGFFLGWRQTVTAFFVGLVLGGLYGIVAMVRRKMGKSDHFAFGPFLCIGLVSAVFCGSYLLDLYWTYVTGAAV